MIAYSDRLPMFPVVHWITRNGRFVLAMLIGGSSVDRCNDIIVCPSGTAPPQMSSTPADSRRGPRELTHHY